MTTAIDAHELQATVRGRSMVRTAKDGTLDGAGDHGVYSNDVRMIRRAEAFGAGREYPVIPEIAVDADGAALRYVIPSVGPGEGVVLIAEIDGSDTFEIRQITHDGSTASVHAAGLGGARPDARVLVSAACDGAALEHRDGVALAQASIPADGTPRTAAWRWRRASDATTADVVVELRVGWSTFSDQSPAAPRSFDELRSSHLVEAGYWLDQRPELRGGDGRLRRVIERSILDLATLRIDGEDGVVFAASIPWHLTLVARDALVAAVMALPIDPRIAVATLRHLARFQAAAYDTAIDAEPGKILHDERHGVAAQRWHERYYGSIDATPLFVTVLAETCAWLADDALARELEPAVRGAIGWIEARIDEDELGMLAHQRRAERGIDVQSWRDSADAHRDRTGRVATGGVRPIEVQGYAIAALNAAAQIAERVWDDAHTAERWREQAAALARRVAASFEVSVPRTLLREDDPRAGGFLASGLDADGAALDALTSSIGHLLCLEALPDPAIAHRTARQLASSALFTGWGVRTMSDLDDGFSPRSPHCGAVWAHDTSVCVAGMARYDFDAAAAVATGFIDAAATTVDGRAPRTYVGSTRRAHDTSVTAVRGDDGPAAVSAAAPLLVARSMLGLTVRDGALASLVEHAPAMLRGVSWCGVHAAGARWDVEVGDDGVVSIARSAR